MKKVNIGSIKEFEEVVSSQMGNLIYLSHDSCGVCKALLPKVERMLVDDFPQIGFVFIDIRKVPELSGQLSVFAVPTILLFIDGKEATRKVRNISVGELANVVERYYPLCI